uniref:Uncharacterized protein n=1 Tax=Arundo donax TaxID=35708 RepID=A0A0A9CRZ8_ARUDO
MNFKCRHHLRYAIKRWAESLGLDCVLPSTPDVVGMKLALSNIFGFQGLIYIVLHTHLLWI